MTSSEKTYIVKSILDHKVVYGETPRADKNRKIVQTTFKVRWEGYGKDGDTWEPLEKLTECPQLVYEFVQRKRAAFQRQLKKRKGRRSTATVPDWSLPPLPLSRFKHRFEYVPKGTEYLERIHKSFVVGGVMFFTVTLENPVLRFVHVRKDVLDYFFTVPMLLRYAKKGVC